MYHNNKSEIPYLCKRGNGGKKGKNVRIFQDPSEFQNFIIDAFGSSGFDIYIRLFAHGRPDYGL